MEHTYDFDLAVIGSGPGGQKAAIMAAKLGKKVCVVDSKTMVGGVCVNTGTIPSKTLREAVMYLTGMQLREMYGASYRVKDEITIADLLARLQHVIGRETEVIRSQLLRNHIELIPGMAAFVDPHTLSVDIEGQQLHRTLTADKVVIATGTLPARPTNVEFDGSRVLDSDQILELENVPGSMVVVGAGVIGVEYASMFAALGTRVTLVESGPRCSTSAIPRSWSRSSSTCATTPCPSGSARRWRRYRAPAAARSQRWPRARRSRPRSSCTPPAARATPVG